MEKPTPYFPLGSQNKLGLSDAVWPKLQCQVVLPIRLLFGVRAYHGGVEM